MRTLITIDGSPESMTALITAQRILRKEDNEIHLLNVTEEIELANVTAANKGGRGQSQSQNSNQQTVLESGAILERARNLLSKEGVNVKIISKTGVASEIITDMAEDYDIVVVGAKGKNTQLQPGLGAVADRVVSQAAGATLVVRDIIDEGDLKILFAVNGSDASNDALEFITNCLDLSSASITLLHVIETAWMEQGMDHNWAEYRGDETVEYSSEPVVQVGNEVHADADIMMDQVRARLARYCSDIEIIIAEGNADTEILGEAEQQIYKLVVTGAMEASDDIKHQTSRGVSNKVAWQAPCSVVLVKPRL